MDSLAQTWVVVVTWRSSARTRALVAHILRTWPTLHVVVVACGGGFTVAPDPRLTIIYGRNLGYAGGNNAGFRAALGRGAKWIVVLNSDAYPLPGSIERLLLAMAARPDLGACGPALVSWTDRGVEINTGTGFNWVTGATSRTPARDAHDPVQFPCGAMILFSATALQQVGGFDSSFFLYYEEIDWCERAREAGFAVAVEPRALCLHLGSRSSARALRAVVYYRARNRLWVLRRYGARHGVHFRTSRQLLVVAHALGSLVLRRRFSLVVPYALGTVSGLADLPSVAHDDAVAMSQQRWETRDAPKASRIRRPLTEGEGNVGLASLYPARAICSRDQIIAGTHVPDSANVPSRYYPMD